VRQAVFTRGDGSGRATCERAGGLFARSRSGRNVTHGNISPQSQLL